jgi:membrane dipeptidase
MNREFPPVLDGHEDFVTAIPRQERDFLTESERGQVDWPRAQRGGLSGTFVSIFLNNSQAEQDVPSLIFEELNHYYRICDRSDGQVRVVRTTTELDRCLAEGTFAGIIHFEGADPISASLTELRVYYELGLRSIGFTWNRATAFGQGVNPGGEESDQGLFEAGFALVEECNRLGILLDVAHLNTAGFWDLARATQKPFVATHANPKAISPHVRNLDDDQIRMIAEKDGTIGLSFANAFLRPDMDPDNDDIPLDLVVSHFEYLINLVGDRHVSIGTDYDGTSVPHILHDATTLPILLREFKARGWSDDRIERLCNGNFRRVLRAVWAE